MSARSRVVAAVVLLACASALADDQGGPAAGVAPLASALGPRLARAVRDGDLERVLGERVLLRADEGEALVLRVARAGDARLRCEVALVTLGGMRAERTRLVAEVDLATGATRALAGEVVRGPERHEVEGPVEADQAALRVRTHRRGGAVDEQTVRAPWPADAVAWPVVLTLAPLIHDAALPARTSLRLSYPLVVLQGGDLGGEPHALVRGDGPPRALRLEAADPAAPAQVVTLGADGAVATIEVPGAGVYTRIDRAAAERLPDVLAPGPQAR